MVASIEHEELFEKSKKFFDEEDIDNTLDHYEKALERFDRSKHKNKSDYINFLQLILDYCQENKLPEQEALVLRALGRTHSLFKQHAESMKYHYQSLKIQKRLGKKVETAEGLVFLAEDLEISGNYDKSIETFQEASELFQDLGKLRNVKDITKELKRLKEFSKEMVEDEYLLNKFNVDKY
ncbi:MAG: tetratricopeptide repeat protein [Candidatus Lokiarchaeota archaeon]|nr:tetratricopeptide repeat protein [Candidatus Lokiarchaeota archaeon]